MKTSPIRSRAFATQLVLASLAWIGASGGLGVAIVNLRQDIAASANTTRLLEQQVIHAERRIAEIGGVIATKQSPNELTANNQALALGLVKPTDSQIIRVAGSATDRLASKRQAEIFASENSRMLTPVRFNTGGAPR
ncbi:MAG: hypothetical protein EAZ36_05815 [Verrucomicrobia bacterium]|nr:MAG: hypothetical protein EAZ36_05815 [Verrucomicrobiota bacterium]